MVMMIMRTFHLSWCIARNRAGHNKAVIACVDVPGADPADETSLNIESPFGLTYVRTQLFFMNMLTDH